MDSKGPIDEKDAILVRSIIRNNITNLINKTSDEIALKSKNVFLTQLNEK
jgi:hypothetical protein